MAQGLPWWHRWDAILFRGRVWISVPAAALRARLLRRDPRVSASYNTPTLALIVHGTARRAEAPDPELEEYEALARELYVELYGAGWLAWFEGKRAEAAGRDFTGHIEPRAIFIKGS